MQASSQLDPLSVTSNHQPPPPAHLYTDALAHCTLLNTLNQTKPFSITRSTCSRFKLLASFSNQGFMGLSSDAPLSRRVSMEVQVAFSCCCRTRCSFCSLARQEKYSSAHASMWFTCNVASYKWRSTTAGGNTVAWIAVTGQSRIVGYQAARWSACHDSM